MSFNLNDPEDREHLRAMDIPISCHICGYTPPRSNCLDICPECEQAVCRSHTDPASGKLCIRCAAAIETAERVQALLTLDDPCDHIAYEQGRAYLKIRLDGNLPELENYRGVKEQIANRKIKKAS